MSIKDNEPSGRPKKPIADDENIRNKKIILDGLKMRLIEIADVISISNKGVEHIVHENFVVRKQLER